MSKDRFIIIYVIVISLVFAFHGKARAQSYHQGGLMISLSEGGTHTHFGTHSTITTNDGGQTTQANGDRDPLTIEYGFTKHWGFGLNMGTDIIKVNPATFYGFETSKGMVAALMSEVTLDAYYHAFCTKHLDLSAFASWGVANVTIKGDDRVETGDMYVPVGATTNVIGNKYQYIANGRIIRVGTKAKYYFRKRFGVMAMFSTFATQCTTEGVKNNTVGNDRATSIHGWALEFGPCFRFF